jgi:5-methylcytosine-specific restriction endonuclease McrA
MKGTKGHVPAALRARVTRQARYRCGYCLCSQELVGMPMTIEHIIPEAAGGSTVEENLWLSCIRCNLFKGPQTHAKDPQTGESVAFFNPRHDVWNEHFAWDEHGIEILGTTAHGRATCTALRLNNPEIVVARRLWATAGWWPPRD